MGLGRSHVGNAGSNPAGGTDVFVLSVVSQDGTDSAWKRSSKTCMKLTSAECTVEHS